MNFALITISSLSLVVSAITLTIVVVGGKKAKDEIDLARTKANMVSQRAADFLRSLEL